MAVWGVRADGGTGEHIPPEPADESTVGGVTVNYTYDALTRVSEKKVGVQRMTSSINQTTTFLNHMNVYGANKVIDYAYIPDRYGNIVQYRDFGNLKATYTYDELNQLVREDNMYSGKSVVYEYDGGGNIVTKKEYGYTTGALGEVQKTVSYGYDEVWKDLLKSYDGQAIAYDGGDEPDRLRMGWVRPAGGTDGKQQDPVPVRRDGSDRVQTERGHLHVCVQRARGRDGDP